MLPRVGNKLAYVNKRMTLLIFYSSINLLLLFSVTFMTAIKTSAGMQNITIYCWHAKHYKLCRAFAYLSCFHVFGNISKFPQITGLQTVLYKDENDIVWHV